MAHLLFPTSVGKGMAVESRVLTGAAQVINILFKSKIWLTHYDM